MKKKYLIIFALAGVLVGALLGYFAVRNGDTDPADEASLLPFTKNLVLHYEFELGGRDDGFSYKSFNAYVNGSKLQRLLVMDDGNFIVEVLEITDTGRMVNTNSFNGIGQWVSPFIDILGSSAQMYQTILPASIALRERWVADPLSSAEQTMREITGMDISITTPAGTFNTIEVTTTRPADETFLVPPTVRTYFAPGIGVVKEITCDGVSVSMASFEARRDNREDFMHTKRLVAIEREGLVLDVPVFYLDGSMGGFPVIQIHFTTNNDLNKLFGEAMGRVSQALFGRELGADILQGAFINPNSQNLHLDFSGEFLSVMQGVTSLEAEERIINAIVDTFGALYNAQGVTITVDNAPYNGVFVRFGSMEFRPVMYHDLYAEN